MLRHAAVSLSKAQAPLPSVRPPSSLRVSQALTEFQHLGLGSPTSPLPLAQSPWGPPTKVQRAGSRLLARACERARPPARPPARRPAGPLADASAC